MIRFVSYSVLLHVLVLLALSQFGSFRHGLDGSKMSTVGAHTVFATIASASGERAIPASVNFAIPKNGGKQNSSMNGQGGFSPGSAVGEVSGDFAKKRKERPDEREERSRGDNFGQRYFVAGKLTRLPFPLTKVDLNVPSITQLSPSQPIEITLLIDANGTVENIISSNHEEQLGDFFQLVAMQFKKVRFSPGEINGKRVNAKLTIAVISEPA